MRALWRTPSHKRNQRDVLQTREIRSSEALIIRTGPSATTAATIVIRCCAIFVLREVGPSR